MTAAPPPPTRSSEVRLGPWLSETFERYADRWQVWIGQGVVFTGVYFLAAVPAIAGMLYWYIPMLEKSVQRPAPKDPSFLLEGIEYFLAGYALLFVVSILVLPWLNAGMTRTAAKQLRGEPISVRDIFSAGDVYFRVVGETILRAILISIGFFACFIPGFIALGLLMYAHQRIVLDDRGVLQAIGDSWDKAKQHVWMYALWGFLVMMIAQFGGNLLLIGMALTWPIWPLATVISHRDVFGIDGAEPRLSPDDRENLRGPGQTI